MNAIQTLIKMLRPKRKWLIDVDQKYQFDDEGEITNARTVYWVIRFYEDGVNKERVAQFDSLEEAKNFITNFKDFPIEYDGVTKDD
jgi:hypothetical protein